MKRVGILTSGGDAPGMNAAVRAVVRAGLYHDLEMFVIYDGYKGLVEGNIQQVDRDFVSDIVPLVFQNLRKLKLVKKVLSN